MGALLKTRKFAAFIMEPVICNLGVLIPEQEFMQEVARLCRRSGTLLILDEVACGFGRTGKLFASEHFGVEPDILCLAKAITGGMAPMGATVTTEAIARKVEGKVHFYSTYGWHPLSVAAALANLRWIKRHQRTLLRNVTARSRDFASRLAQMPWQADAKIRIKGLAVGIDLGNEDDVEELAERCRKSGLLVSADGDALTLFPALTIDEQTVREGLDILETCL